MKKLDIKEFIKTGKGEFGYNLKIQSVYDGEHVTLSDGEDIIGIIKDEIPTLIDILIAIQNKDLNMLTEDKKDAIIESCEFCDKHCGNKWCYTNKE